MKTKTKTYPPRRLDDGLIVITAMPPPPTAKKIAAAKREAAKNLKKKEILAHCALCEVETAVPSDVKLIRDYGVCFHCDYYLKGKFETIFKHELPTYEAVKDRVEKGLSLGYFEQKVLLERIAELEAENGRLRTT